MKQLIEFLLSFIAGLMFLIGVAVVYLTNMLPLIAVVVIGSLCGQALYDHWWIQ